MPTGVVSLQHDPRLHIHCRSIKFYENKVFMFIYEKKNRWNIDENVYSEKLNNL